MCQSKNNELYKALSKVTPRWKFLCYIYFWAFFLPPPLLRICKNEVWTLSHFENECDVTAYFQWARLKHALFSLREICAHAKKKKKKTVKMLHWRNVKIAEMRIEHTYYQNTTFIVLFLGVCLSVWEVHCSKVYFH